MEVGQIYELKFHLGDGDPREITALKGKIVDRTLDGGEIHLALFEPYNKMIGVDKVWLKVHGGVGVIAYYYDDPDEPPSLFA